MLEVEWETGTDPLTDFNVLKGTYTSAAHDFQEQEAPERRNESLLTTQPERTELLEIPWCPSGYQMQRLMKTYEARQRPAVIGTVRTNLVGLKARFPKGDGIHTIRLDTRRLSGVFEVVGHSYSLTEGVCAIQVRAIWDAWAWDAATEEQNLPPALDDLAQNNPDAALPENLVLSQELVAISEQTSGVRIVANVDDPGRPDLQLVLEYRRDGETDWNRMEVAPGARRGVSGVLAEGDYSVRAYWLGQGASEAAYPVEEITVLSNPITPDAPTDFTGWASGEQVTLQWHNAASNYAKTRVFINSADSFAGASFLADVSGLPDQQSTLADTPGNGTWFYWIVTINPSGVTSSPTGSVEIGITPDGR